MRALSFLINELPSLIEPCDSIDDSREIRSTLELGIGLVEYTIPNSLALVCSEIAVRVNCEH